MNVTTAPSESAGEARFAIRPAVEVPALPGKQSILVDGKVVGEATPSLRDDALSWHAVIRMPTTGWVGYLLVQGFGKSVREAVADGIEKARGECEGAIKAIVKLDEALRA
jgi:hypothetical protein